MSNGTPRSDPGRHRRTWRLARQGLGTYLDRWHRHEVRSELPLPPAPAVVVANHGFGGIVDLNVLALVRTLFRAGGLEEVTFLVHQLAWTLGVGGLLEQLGCEPAGREAADRAISRGHYLVVFPGGDLEAARPWRDRDRLRFAGRTGYARLAITHGVPIVPVVTVGAGESLLVLSDGQELARRLRLPSLLRTKTMPISVSLPWGLSLGAVGVLLPYLPLPTKLVTVVLPALHPREGEDERALADRTERAMQRAIDEAVRDRRPVLG